MLPNLHTFHQPSSLDEALALLLENPGRVVPIAGGTHLVAYGGGSVTDVVDITRLGLSYIRRTSDTVRIGATTTLQELIDAPMIGSLAGGLITEACKASTVSRMIRNVSTAGGNVVVASASSGLPVALLALDARLRFRGGSNGEVTLSDYYAQSGSTAFNGVLIEELILPIPSPQTRATILRLGSVPSAIPIIQMAVAIEIMGDLVRMCRIALSAATRSPARVGSAEVVLLDQRLDEQTIAMSSDAVAASILTISDTLGSAEYRRHLSRILTRRALSLLARGTQG